MSPIASRCPHLDDLVTLAEPHSTVCDACVKLGDTWVHLRACLICGHVGCCDNSKNRHATAHYRDTDHPLIKSIEPGERWLYCYPEQLMMVPHRQRAAASRGTPSVPDAS